MKDSNLIPVERIEKAIYLIRGEKVMLDRDLAALYEVETRVLNQAVRRNRERFPLDFMFELTREEITGISQIVTSSNLKFSKRVSVLTEPKPAVAPFRGRTVALAEAEASLATFITFAFQAFHLSCAAATARMEDSR
jgi:hypothetical protein